MQKKFVFITGGVISSLGKGLAAASIARLLELRGLRVAMLKLDPYLNVDPGTMSPFQHGEVYVTDDGAETDLDLGHYYRYTNSPLSKFSNSTTGQIYETVIKRERKGDYLGKTVQVIPHITDEIKRRIHICAEQEDDIQVVFVEIGGTVGDIESLPFLEAIRQFRNDKRGDCINIHLTLVPYIKSAGEMKTKPTQHSVQMLREIGILPDMLLCRSEFPLSDEIKSKISLFCNVAKDAVIEAKDVKNSIYEVPLNFHEQGTDGKICELLNIKTKKPDLSAWENFIHTITHPKRKIRVGIIGKYLDHQDAYKSILESLNHAAINNESDIEIVKIESDKIKDDKDIDPCDGYLVPGGFGERGWEGKILATRYCRENNIPYFGICLGMQVLVVEYTRNVLNLPEANSLEIDPKTQVPVISLMAEQKEVANIGGTMRLGAYPCRLDKKSNAYKAYGNDLISERHRHRYEVNNDYKVELEKKGLSFTGMMEKGNLCEIAEVQNHPWMLAVQFHPEFKSKPLAPHPLFNAFIKAIIERKEKK